MIEIPPFLTGIRRLFYLVTPNETLFRKTEDVPEYINQAAPFFLGFVIVEFIFSAILNDDRKRYNDSLTSIGAGIFSRLPGVLFKSITVSSYIWLYENYHLYDVAWNSRTAWWICFLAIDFGYYWFHRLAHEVNFMWASHQVHHSSEFYNFSTALRQSVLQEYTSWVFYLPIALFVPPPIFIVHHELVILYQFWIHTEYVRTLGPLEYVLNTPSHHRVHHGRNRYCIDKNYAGTLIIWDRMFGTFEAEAEEVCYGLTHPVATFDQFEIQFGFAKYMFGKIADMKGTFNKLAAVLYGPGWMPGKPRTGELEDIPDVHAPATRFDAKVPKWINVYVLIHFLIVFIGYQELYAKKELFNQTYLLGFIFFIGYSLTAFGRLFDGKNSGIMMEIIRCLMYLIGDLILVNLNFYDEPNGSLPVQIIRVVFIISLAMWMIMFRTTFKASVPGIKKRK